MQQNNQYFNDVSYQRELFVGFINSQEKLTGDVLKKALELAENLHQNQTRDDGVSYIIHPIRVALFILRDLKIKDTNLIVAALLHDVVEDCGIKLEEIEKLFSKRIANLVDSLTRSRPSGETEEQKKISKKKELEKIMLADKAVRIIKCSDLLDNMRSWVFISLTAPSEKKFSRWIEEAEKHYIPIAEKTDTEIAIKMRQALATFKDRLDKK